MGRRSRHSRESTTDRTPAQGAPDRVEAPFAGPRGAIFVLGVAIVLTVLAYSNAVGGKFVYDDEKQIATNPLIQEPRLFAKALVSDVWAFTGEQGKAWSNYWRPLFITWLSWNWRWFGSNTAGWHVGNIVLHAIATSLGFFVLRRLGLKPEVCAIATWLFAVHPAHVESITWISGAPDPMLASFLFGSYLCHLAASSWFARAAALALFAGALLCKEIAIVFPAVVLFTEAVLPRAPSEPIGATALRSLRVSLPFVGVALVYLIARSAVGMRHIVPPGAPGLDGVVLSAPSVLVFYIRHALFPIALGPSYPLSPVTAENLSFGNFVLPLAIALALAYGVFRLLRRDVGYRLTLLWFLLPLAPVFDVRSFIREDFVHDRYLYLPLFGALAFVIMAVWELSARAGVTGKALAIAGLALAVALVPVTRAYNRAWMDEVSLWERGVRSNPETAFPHAQLGGAYRQAGRLGEAKTEFERALALNPGITTAHIGIAAVLFREGRLDEAESHLKTVLDQYPDLAPALDQLGLVYEKEGRIEDAIAVFERARRAIPYRAALYTVNVAVLHRMANRSNEAQRELESILDRLETTTDPSVLRGYWYLGELYREQGQTDRAIALYEKYLTATATMVAPDVVARRKIVEKQLRESRGR
jgi:tetratricopeptide (TPR) repeat protein